MYSTTLLTVVIYMQSKICLNFICIWKTYVYDEHAYVCSPFGCMETDQKELNRSGTILPSQQNPSAFHLDCMLNETHHISFPSRNSPD